MAEARGAIVSKDELLRTVWPGIVVEENALQVHVSSLRKALGEDASRLKTIRGVGYRLDLDRDQDADLQVPRERLRIPGAWRGFVGMSVRQVILGAFAALGTTGALLVINEPPVAEEFIAVNSVQGSGGEQASALANNLQVEILDVLAQSGIQATHDESGGTSAASEANRVISGTVVQTAQDLKVHLLLKDVPSGRTLWSKRFERDRAAADQLATEASVAAARTIYTIHELFLQKDVKLDPVAIALHIRGSEMVRGRRLLEEGTPREIYQRLVARVPGAAHGHGLLAMAWANEARLSIPAARPALLASGKSEAAKAVAIDPAGAGAAYDALYIMSRTEHPRQLARSERHILEGLRNAPAFPFLSMRRCRFLTEVGRPREALSYCQRALALHPYAEPIGHSYARALSAAGAQNFATDTIERSIRNNPEHEVTRRVRLELAAFGGRPDVALDLIDEPATRPQDMSSAEQAILRRYLRRHGQWSAQERADLARQFRQSAEAGTAQLDWAIMALASLGHTDAAFDLIGSPRMDEILFRTGSGFLFQPVTAPLRADPRFWSAAAELGLASYWQASGKWPEMCGQEMAIAVCRTRIVQALRDTDA